MHKINLTLGISGVDGRNFLQKDLGAACAMKLACTSLAGVKTGRMEADHVYTPVPDV